MQLDRVLVADAKPGEEPCHYCGLWVGVTADHIVPRSLYRPMEPDEPPRYDNFVRACSDCNSSKSQWRVLHDCQRCEAAWIKYGPRDWTTTVSTVSLKWVTGRARGREKATVRSKPKSKLWVDQFPRPVPPPDPTIYLPSRREPYDVQPMWKLVRRANMQDQDTAVTDVVPNPYQLAFTGWCYIDLSIEDATELTAALFAKGAGYACTSEPYSKPRRVYFMSKTAREVAEAWLNEYNERMRSAGG